MSIAILKLSENGDLQRIHDKWLMLSACTSPGAKLEVDRLHLRSFWGLFVLCGLACFLALFIYMILIIRQFSRHCPQELGSSGPNLQSGRFQTFLSFVDEKDKIVKERSKRREMEGSSSRSVIASNRSRGEFELTNSSNGRYTQSLSHSKGELENDNNA